MPDGPSHRLLGLACGEPGGSAELLLRAALRAAASPALTVELVRLDDLRLPAGPDRAAIGGPDDDGPWLWERLVECDALVVSTPIISRTVPGRLKLLGDRLLGPNADAAIVDAVLRARAGGHDVPLPFRVDARVLKPRVAGFLAVGGSLTPQWKALTLPLLHTLTFSMQTAVVDQVQFAGAGTPRSIVLDDAAMARAGRLGAAVAAQVGRPFAEVEYRGDAPGPCPMCHLDVVVLRGRALECATCGARGRLEVRDGEPVPVFDDLSTSVIGMAEKHDHFEEIKATAAAHAAQAERIAAAAAQWDGGDHVLPGTPTAGAPAAAAR